MISEEWSGFIKDFMCAGKMVQWVTVLAAGPDNPSVISGTHTVEEKNQLLEAILWPQYIHTLTHTHKITKMQQNIFKAVLVCGDSGFLHYNVA